jgi:hypothetical protein
MRALVRARSWPVSVLVSLVRCETDRVVPATSGGQCTTSFCFSDGVIRFRVCRGRPLSRPAISSSCASVKPAMLLQLGKYWRNDRWCSRSSRAATDWWGRRSRPARRCRRRISCGWRARVRGPRSASGAADGKRLDLAGQGGYRPPRSATANQLTLARRVTPSSPRRPGCCDPLPCTAPVSPAWSPSSTRSSG